SPPAYDYAEDAAGVERVPIPVWATRSFQATWAVPLSREKPPIAADVTLSRNDGKPAGDITNNLPVALKDVTLFYQGKTYDFGDLAPGETRRVGVIYDGQRQAREPSQWFDPSVSNPNPNPAPRGGVRGNAEPMPQGRSQVGLMKAVLFHRLAQQQRTESGNSGLRPLDQSWRVEPEKGRRDEIILVARADERQGPAEQVSRDGV